MDDDIQKLLEKNKKLKSLIDAANEQIENLKEQILSNETMILNSYFTQEGFNPRTVFTRVLMAATPLEEKLIRNGLNTKYMGGWGHRKYYETMGDLVGVHRVTASRSFNKAIRKFRHLSPAGLVRLIDHCEKLIDISGIKKEKVDTYLKENFFLEFNFIHFVFGFQKYLNYNVYTFAEVDGPDNGDLSLLTGDGQRGTESNPGEAANEDLLRALMEAKTSEDK